MGGARWALVIVGVLVFLAGIVMSLQGANYIGGSALMSGNSTYIYVGGVVAVIGLIIVAFGFRGRNKTAMGMVQQTTN